MKLPGWIWPAGGAVLALGGFAAVARASSGDRAAEEADGEVEKEDEGGGEEPEAFGERRVRVRDYASLSAADERMIVLPGDISFGGARRLHAAVVEDLKAMLRDMRAAGLPATKVSSAWRPRRWKSRAEYEDYLVKKYGKPGWTRAQSVKEGQRWLAFESPHETGLTVDLRSTDLEAKSATANKQKTTPSYAWLKANASKYGWYPYLKEPWHWEHPIPKEDF